MKNKNFALLVVCVLFIGSIAAQNKVERYCKINVSPVRRYGEDISINYGKSDAFLGFKDTTIARSLDKVHDFHNGIDALNYMSSLGWEIINISYYVRRTEFEVYYSYYFKKLFEKQDLQ